MFQEVEDDGYEANRWKRKSKGKDLDKASYMKRRNTTEDEKHRSSHKIFTTGNTERSKIIFEGCTNLAKVTKVLSKQTDGLRNSLKRYGIDLQYRPTKTTRKLKIENGRLPVSISLIG